jgi:hypothetical protein
MDKPTKLRAYLAQSVPALAKNPEKLHLFIEKGQVSSWLGNSLGFMYRTPVKIYVTDYPDHPDTLIVPLLSWISVNQVDLLQHPDRKENAIQFDAELLSNNCYDLEITLNLTESVDVAINEAGQYTCNHRQEPDLPDLGGPTGWQLYVNNQLVAEAGNG